MPESKDLYDCFASSLKIYIGENGLDYLNGIAVTQYKDDGITFMAIARDYHPDQSFMLIYNELNGGKTGNKLAVEAVLGLDFWVDEKLNQGNEFKDFIAVFHRMRDFEWRYGVIDYQKPIDGHEGQQKIIREVNWNHPYWQPRLKGIHMDWRARFWPNNLVIQYSDERGRVVIK
jgi:hypothetical protein